MLFQNPRRIRICFYSFNFYPRTKINIPPASSRQNLPVYISAIKFDMCISPCVIIPQSSLLRPSSAVEPVLQSTCSLDVSMHSTHLHTILAIVIIWELYYQRVEAIRLLLLQECSWQESRKGMQREEVTFVHSWGHPKKESLLDGEKAADGGDQAKKRSAELPLDALPPVTACKKQQGMCDKWRTDPAIFDLLKAAVLINACTVNACAANMALLTRIPRSTMRHHKAAFEAAKEHRITLSDVTYQMIFPKAAEYGTTPLLSEDDCKFLPGRYSHITRSLEQWHHDAIWDDCHGDGTLTMCLKKASWEPLWLPCTPSIP